MERLNEKYNLDCFLSSELDSESDEENNITMSMGMRHLSEKCKTEFIKFCDDIIFEM